MLLGEIVGINVCWKRGERSRIRQRETLGWDAGLMEASASLAERECCSCGPAEMLLAG